MGKPMKQYMMEQPEAVRSVIREVPAEVSKVLRVTGTDYDVVYLLGSGTSLNAAYAAKPLFEAWTGAQVHVMLPFDFLHYYPESKLDGRSIVFGISQTARSTCTIDSVTKAKACGARTVFVTAEPENDGADCADVIFNTCTGEELVGAKTKGYTTTMAAMFLLAAAFGQRRLDLSAVPGYMEAALEASKAAMPRLVAEFSDAPAFVVVGYGPCMSAVREGGLKLLETVRVPVEIYDVEEYMHGPYHCLEASSRLIFIAPEGKGQERIARLIRFCESITKHTLIIGNRSFVTAVGSNLILPLPDGIPEELAPLGCVIPMQWLANDLTLQKGRKPEASRYPNFHKELGSKFMPKVNYYTGK